MMQDEDANGAGEARHPPEPMTGALRRACGLISFLSDQRLVRRACARNRRCAAALATRRALQTGHSLVATTTGFGSVAATLCNPSLCIAAKA
jgi:hypothetical protein